MATATHSEPTARAKTALSYAWILLALLPVAYGLIVSLIHLKATWDDAAITAAFARTWAQTGHIALTPISQTVEGFSSVLWFLLLSIPYFFTHHADAGLVWMRALAALFFALSIGLTYSIAKRQLRSEYAGVACALLFALCTTPLREMQNGMEMNLATFLLLALFRVLSESHHRILYGSALASLLLLARFESPFMLLLIFCGFMVAGKNRRDLLKAAVITLFAFLLIELARHHLFGAWMPNTVYAKRWPPYSDWSTPEAFFKTRIIAVLEVLLVLPAPIIAALLRRRSPKVHPAVWLLASGCVLFGAMFGHNTGPAGRMVEPMLPFLLITLVGACSFRATGFVLLICAQGLVWAAEQSTLPYGNVSVTRIENAGLAADALRVHLHRDSLTIMVPDIGGSALCCEHLDIVDAAMLADPELAHKGWSDFANRFHRANPDVVWTEPPWSTRAHIFTSGLLSGYYPEESRGVRLYVRRDLHQCVSHE